MLKIYLKQANLKKIKYKMDEKLVKLSDAVAKLLSSENKDKSLGETSKELNEYIIQIKELVEKGDISYDTLQEEISKHLNENDITVPGSLAQLLIGCISTDGSCPLQKSKKEDIPFAYDNKLNKIIPLSSKIKPDNKESYAVLYITGNPANINLESLYYLHDTGFNKLKIQYKEITSASYNTLYVENLKKYIYSQPEQNNSLYIVGIFIVLLLIFFISSR
jgi:hypothetical protein